MTEQTKAETVPLKDDLVVGVKAIANFLGESERRTYHLIASGQLPGIFKMGNRHCGRRSTILKNIERREQGAA